MKTRIIAASAMALLLPALAFLLSVALQGMPGIPALADVAHRVVAAYATRRWTLWVLLIALPIQVILLSLQALRSDAGGHPPATSVLRATLVLSQAILLFVGLHMAAN
jgi:hypothetical protein